MLLRSIALFFFAGIARLASGQSPYQSKVWVADKGNGTYHNPILFADYSDPDVIRIGTDYYLTASSFNCIPGLPILHSKDLVNWRIINYALKQQVPDSAFASPQHGKGVWAPSFNYHNHELYIFYPDPDFGIYMIKTKDPAGEWSKPVLVLPGKGVIDPTSFWDDNGNAYLAVGWANSRAGVNSIITIFRMNADGSKVIDEGRHVYDGHGIDPTIEGPKLYKRNGYYYIFAPAGGVSTGWQLALRSKNIYGPYERKVVMDQGNTAINGPHQGAWVTTASGESWFLHFQDREAYGRITHLEPVNWKNDWPVIGTDADGDGKGEPVIVYKKPNVGRSWPIETPVESDEFNTDELGLQWQWHANSKIQWSALLRGKGFLRLFAYPSDIGPNLWSVPNLLLQKLPAPEFVATTKMQLTIDNNNFKSKKAGLLIMGEDYSYLAITKDEKGFWIKRVACKNASKGTDEEVIAQKQLQNNSAYLRITVSAPDAECSFSYSEDGTSFQTLGPSFRAKPGRWIGAKIGLFCTGSPKFPNGGYAEFDWFRITAL